MAKFLYRLGVIPVFTLASVGIAVHGIYWLFTGKMTIARYIDEITDKYIDRMG